MPDLIDSILDSMSASSLELLDRIDLDSDRESKQYSSELQKSLNDMESAYLKRCAVEIDHKTNLLVSKTRKYKSILDKYTKQFEKVQFRDLNTDNIKKKKKSYVQQIESIEKELNGITNFFGKDGAEEVFLKIEEMDKEIEQLLDNTKTLRYKIKDYEGFPANLKDAEYCITELKERIQKKEAEWESGLHGK